jgi:hypothetical protein
MEKTQQPQGSSSSSVAPGSRVVGEWVRWTTAGCRLSGDESGLIRSQCDRGPPPPGLGWWSLHCAAMPGSQSCCGTGGSGVSSGVGCSARCEPSVSVLRTAAECEEARWDHPWRRVLRPWLGLCPGSGALRCSWLLAGVGRWGCHHRARLTASVLGLRGGSVGSGGTGSTS